MASKPPSKGPFIWEPPSELVAQTERHPPVATMDGRLQRCCWTTSLEFWSLWNIASSEDRRNKCYQRHLAEVPSTSEYRFYVSLLYTTYPTTLLFKCPVHAPCSQPLNTQQGLSSQAKVTTLFQWIQPQGLTSQRKATKNNDKILFCYVFVKLSRFSNSAVFRIWK